MSSSEQVNFSIRPNKFVERKFLFEILSLLPPELGLSGYKYVGLGAPWFIDFIMAHRMLSIKKMVSIEKNEIIASRAKFNRPYACVEVIPGDSETVLNEMDMECDRHLVWLDYDSGPEGPVFNDTTTLCQKLESGSIMLATVNAHPNRLPKKNESGEEYEEFTDRFHGFFGDKVPNFLRGKRLAKSKYSFYLASVVFAHIHRQVRKAGRTGEKFLAFINFSYSDNAPMVTIGGAIVDENMSELIRSSLTKAGLEYLLSEDDLVRIDVPPLTYKEKSVIDQKLPKEDPLTEDDVLELGFRLKRNQIESYHKFYRYYPVFGEISI